MAEEAKFTRSEVRDIVRETVKETIGDVFDRLGVDLTDRESVERHRQDMMFLRKQRRGAEETAKIIRATAIGAFVSGALWLVFWGAQKAFGGGA